MKISAYIPEKGFYYHYKHDPAGPVASYAYEVIGVGLHTEDDCRPQDAQLVIYRPLYEEARVYKAGKLFDVRPWEMFMENVETPNGSVPRFRKIDDPQVISLLAAFRDRMYPQEPA